jgi:hypothetical protein
MKRRRFKQTKSLEERLADEQAQLLPPGAVREAIMKRARQAETGSHISDWLRWPGLRAPTSGV